MYNTNAVINDIFKKWSMLERIWFATSGSGACFETYDLHIDDSIFSNTKQLQALYLANGNLIFNQNGSSNDSDTLTSMENWQNMVFLEMQSITIQEDYVLIFFNSFGKYMTNLIYLTINRASPFTQFPQLFCNFSKTLQYLELSFHNIDKIGNCFDNFNNLRFFKIYTSSTSYVPLEQIFNLPKIEIIALIGLELTWNTIVNEMYTNDTFNYSYSYNENSIKELYLQSNELCTKYHSMSENTTQYAQLVNMIDKYNACDNLCTTEIYEILCPTFSKLSICYNNVPSNITCEGNCIYLIHILHVHFIM